jgi:type I restriction enzyme M protein
VRSDLDDFVTCYNPANRQERKETDRFKSFTYDELLARDKASLDIFWLRDESLEDTDNLPPPEVIAAEIVEDLQAALAEFTAVAESLRSVN